MRIQDDFAMACLAEDPLEGYLGYDLRRQNIFKYLARANRRQLVYITDHNQASVQPYCLEQRVHQSDIDH